MSGAWRDGWRRALAAPWLIVGLWASTLLIAAPLAAMLGRALADHLGSSLAAASAAAGVNHDWWNEFLAQTSGLGATFVPTIIGFAAVVKNVGGLADAHALPPEIVGAVGGSFLLTLFLLGGVLDRLARDRTTGSHGFFSACGVYFFRLLRLAVIAGALYWYLFTRIHPLLFDWLYPRLTHDLTEERIAFAYRVGLYLVFWTVVLAFNVFFDYAKIRMVVEDRRSAIGAITAALGFVRRQPGAVLALYLLNTLSFIALIALYGLVAPGVGGGGWVWLGLLISQTYIAARLLIRLTFAASQISLFQSRLAHAGYTARGTSTWPESAVAEAVRPQ